MSSVFEKWVVIFPGKMGLSWKLAFNSRFTREEAEAMAEHHCNTVVVPEELYLNMKDKEKRMVRAERELADIRHKIAQAEANNRMNEG